MIPVSIFQIFCQKNVIPPGLCCLPWSLPLDLFVAKDCFHSDFMMSQFAPPPILTTLVMKFLRATTEYAAPIAPPSSLVSVILPFNAELSDMVAVVCLSAALAARLLAPASLRCASALAAAARA